MEPSSVDATAALFDNLALLEGTADQEEVSEEAVAAAQLSLNGITPSEEQTAIVNAVVEGCNVQVDAVAGSGKTTTILFIARALPGHHILLLTYNARLKVETRERCAALGINNLEVRSYHSFCVRYYWSRSHTDLGMLKVLRREVKSAPFTAKGAPFDLIIVDEAQDMIPLYYRLLQRIIYENDTAWEGQSVQLCVLGDYRQCIFAFKDADARFLTLAPDIMPHAAEPAALAATTTTAEAAEAAADTTTAELAEAAAITTTAEAAALAATTAIAPRPWRRLSLSVSHRLTCELADFLNHCVLGQERVKARPDKHGPKPIYVATDMFWKPPGDVWQKAFYKSTAWGALQEIKQKIKAGVMPLDEVKKTWAEYLPLIMILEAVERYGCANIFVLAPSVKQKKSRDKLHERIPPVCAVSNMLSVLFDVPVFVPRSDDDEKVDDAVMHGKLVFANFHQVKGLERKVVFIFAYDAIYEAFYNRDSKPESCSNAHYVALTRSSYILVLFQHRYEYPLTCLKVERLGEYTLRRGRQGAAMRHPCIANDGEGFERYLIASDLFQHLPAEMLTDYYDRLAVTTLVEGVPETIPPAIARQGELYEVVCDITAAAVYLSHQWITQGRVAHMFNLEPRHPCLRCDSCGELLLLPKRLLVPIWLKLANHHLMHESGLLHRYHQITDYTWMNAEQMNRAQRQLKGLGLSDDCEYEYDLVMKVGVGHVHGRADCVDFKQHVLYEFKYVKELQYEHHLQLAVYALLFYLGKHQRSKSIGEERDWRFVLLNIATGEKKEVLWDELAIKELARDVVHRKTLPQLQLTSEEFLRDRQEDCAFIRFQQAIHNDPA